MQLTETLDELLDLFHARICALGPDYIRIHSMKQLPETVNKIAEEVSVSMSSTPIFTKGGYGAVEIMSGTPSYEYRFNNDAREALRALLFLATEKERYDKFCKSIDTEIEEELSDTEE